VTVPHPRGHHEGGSEQSPSWWNRDPARRQQAVVAVAVLVVGAAAAAFVLNRGDDSSTKTSSGQAQRQSRAVPTPSPEGLASASIPAPVTLQTTAPAPSTPTPEPPAGPPQDVARQAFASVPGQAPDGTDASGRPVSYAATNLLDGDPTTCWRVAGDASGSVLTFQLPATRQVTSVGLINGYAKVDPATGDDRYAQERRITRVTWVFPGGTQITQRLTDDTRTLQSIDVPATEATGVVALRIDHTVRPGKAAFDYTAISTVDIEAR
jgi:hypothetical protein